jgi:hypothetical protein
VGLEALDSHTGEVALHDELPMDRAAQLLAEVRILGTLCNREIASEFRAELVRTLKQYVFLEPEHQVVFESICSLLPQDRISSERLAVHLNNRGFPDVDLAKYSAAALADIEDALKLSRQLGSSGRGFSEDAHYDRQRKVDQDA